MDGLLICWIMGLCIFVFCCRLVRVVNCYCCVVSVCRLFGMMFGVLLMVLMLGVGVIGFWLVCSGIWFCVCGCCVCGLILVVLMVNVMCCCVVCLVMVWCGCWLVCVSFRLYMVCWYGVNVLVLLLLCRWFI